MPATLAENIAQKIKDVLDAVADRLIDAVSPPPPEPKPVRVRSGPPRS